MTYTHDRDNYSRRQQELAKARRRYRNPLRRLRTGSFFPFGTFAIFATAIILFHIITLMTGIAHYEFYGFFAGFRYEFHLGSFDYIYQKGFTPNGYVYQKSYDF